jgi:small-conductance mechanosensitive channel
MKEILSYQLFHIGGYTLHVHNLLGLLILIIISGIILRFLNRGIRKNKKIDEGAKYSIKQLARYTVIAVTVLVAITILGFDLSVLFVGSAALLVGIGFGLQHLFNDFISGIIILFDGTIKVNDVIEVDGIVCRVKEIKLRTTAVMTREDKFIILPNSVITQGKVVNWTYSHHTSRFEITVNVSYDEDITAVMSLFKEVALQHKAVATAPEPSIRITRFAEWSVEITIMFWCSQVFRVENIKSEIRVAIFKAMTENNIRFPYPQSVIQYKDKDRSAFDPNAESGA